MQGYSSEKECVCCPGFNSQHHTHTYTHTQGHEMLIERMDFLTVEEEEEEEEAPSSINHCLCSKL